MEDQRYTSETLKCGDDSPRLVGSPFDHAETDPTADERPDVVSRKVGGGDYGSESRMGDFGDEIGCGDLEEGTCDSVPERKGRPWGQRRSAHPVTNRPPTKVPRLLPRADISGPAICRTRQMEKKAEKPKLNLHHRGKP